MSRALAKCMCHGKRHTTLLPWPYTREFQVMCACGACGPRAKTKKDAREVWNKFRASTSARDEKETP